MRSAKASRPTSETVVRHGPSSIPWDEWGRWVLPVDLACVGNRCLALPADLPEWTEGLFRLAEGPEAAFVTRRTWHPAYGLAMRADGGFAPRQIAALDEAAARKYLAGEIMPGDAEGWAVAMYLGLPLGWVKGIPPAAGPAGHAVLKNHLPRSARLIG